MNKENNGKRFFVTAQNYPSGLKVLCYSSDRAWAEKIFRGQYQNHSSGSMFAYEFGIALCSVSRYGRVSWGLFEPLPIN